LPDDNNGVLNNLAVSELLRQFAANNTEPQPESVLKSQQALIDACCAAEEPQVIVNRILACSADSDWWRECQANLRGGSPLTARVIFRQLQMTVTMTLAEVFQLDYLLATTIVRHPEFAEGVRALLVDKDRQPRWLFDSVDEVPDGVLDGLFTAPWPVNPLAGLD
jgi:enoyl-CoA hydratase/carnithine racemase